MLVCLGKVFPEKKKVSLAEVIHVALKNRGFLFFFFIWRWGWGVLSTFISTYMYYMKCEMNVKVHKEETSRSVSSPVLISWWTCTDICKFVILGHSRCTCKYMHWRAYIVQAEHILQGRLLWYRGRWVFHLHILTKSSVCLTRIKIRDDLENNRKITASRELNPNIAEN